MKVNIDKGQFGPWALITGASSGIGREFARQLAKAGLNTVLAARRRALLEEVGSSLANDFGGQYRVITADFSEEGFADTLANSTDDLDIGLVVSNAGSPRPGRFLSKDRDELACQLRLNALSHLDIAHHFGRKLAARGRGGLIFVSAMGAEKGIPYMANDAGAKAYVQSLAQALHVELRPVGVHGTVVFARPNRDSSARDIGPHFGNHAHEADEGRAMCLGSASRPCCKSLAGYSRPHESNPECDRSRERHPDDDGKNVREIARPRTSSPAVQSGRAVRTSSHTPTPFRSGRTTSSIDLVPHSP
jgi:short-subunit dehydrogenase